MSSLLYTKTINHMRNYGTLQMVPIAMKIFSTFASIRVVKGVGTPHLLFNRPLLL